jgi:hypothetical protein
MEKISSVVMGSRIQTALLSTTINKKGIFEVIVSAWLMIDDHLYNFTQSLLETDDQDEVLNFIEQYDVNMAKEFIDSCK